MSTARKYQLAHRSKPVTETDRLDEIAEAGWAIAKSLDAVARGFDNLARATCVLAVKQEARNPGEQRELGAILWADVVSDFAMFQQPKRCGPGSRAFLHIDPKAFPKRPYGR
jgi:hypothetical protein